MALEVRHELAEDEVYLKCNSRVIPQGVRQASGQTSQVYTQEMTMYQPPTPTPGLEEYITTRIRRLSALAVSCSSRWPHTPYR